MAVETSGVLPCVVFVMPKEGVVGPGVDVEEPLAKVVRPGGVLYYTIVVRIDYRREHGPARGGRGHGRKGGETRALIPCEKLERERRPPALDVRENRKYMKRWFYSDDCLLEHISWV
jgi:hypothetical protein